ncbi:hypothetical protein [Psychrobacter lutiphocae]|nr:hypothetical protein [Psychrobacter lutiphocae]
MKIEKEWSLMLQAVGCITFLTTLALLLGMLIWAIYWHVKM